MEVTKKVIKSVLEVTEQLSKEEIARVLNLSE